MMKHFSSKTEMIRCIATAAVFCLLIALFGVGALLSPDREYSVYERRKLEQMPTLAESENLSAYFSSWETYLSDQFFLRDPLRFVKSSFAHTILRQKDVNGYYSEDGSQAQLLYPMNDENFSYNIGLMETVRETYFPDSPTYYGVIPDKSYYMDAPLGLDYDEIDRLFAEGLSGEEIPLREALELDDYYQTDIHWKQESLEEVYEAFRERMGAHLPPWSDESGDRFTESMAGEFYGVLYGQAAMPAERDEMRYLQSDSTAEMKVTVIDTGKEGKIYDLEAFAGDDAYDLYLGGESAIIRIENPNAASERKLILFRDSFGRSMAPLLAEGYSEVVLVDLRWIRSAFLSNFTEVLAADENTDVLFLYSAQVLNSMKLG